MNKFSCLLCLLIGFNALLFGQVNKRQAHINPVVSSVVVDGNLSEGEWKEVNGATDFWQYFPSDTSLANFDTEIYFQYDEENLYVGIRCYSQGNDYVLNSLKRDYRAWGNDNLTLVFDTFKDGTNAFVFGITPYGVRREALISGGGNQREDFSSSWDNKWYGDSKMHEGYWTAELAIPFKSIRFDQDIKVWGFNSYRFDLQNNERSTWVQIPQNQMIMNLGFTGDLIWKGELPEPKRNISLIPYITGTANKVVEDNGNIVNDQFGGFGGDAKIGLGSGLNLDLTINPDFSQVEVDEQVTDLNRFEIFFPERRQFFLENADLFGGFGFGVLNPFFSRRIGVAKDTMDGASYSNPILFGARLSGKLNEYTRLGLLTIQTAANEEYGLPSYNYSVATVQKKVFERSNIGFIMVNKEHFNEDTDATHYSKYNRVVGSDFNLFSKDNRWTGKVFYHHSLSDTNESGGGQHGAEVTYTNNRYQFNWNHQYVNEDFDAEVGFIIRKNAFRLNPNVTRYIFPDSKTINRIDLRLGFEQVVQPGGGLLDRNVNFGIENRFKSTANLELQGNLDYILLTGDFDPTGVDTISLKEGDVFQNAQLELSYRSNNNKLFTFGGRLIGGQFFGGKRYGLRANMSYRLGVLGSLSLTASYNYLDREAPYSSASLFLLGPKFDLSFTKKLFWTTFLQYNNQSDNFNINSRLQWRFLPASDMFLVYTDNYYSDFSANKNRAIVLKVSYWLNM
jgi:hypothetical protein